MQTLYVQSKLYGRGNYCFICILFCLCTHNISFAQSAKSDSLFAIGVDLYNAGKYQEAIPIFTECARLDKAELDSTSNRRDYSAMWLASCYYHLNDSVKAQQISSYYKFTPVDRRLTIESDSLSYACVVSYQVGNIESALTYALQCAEIEKSIVGEKHIWYGNSINNIGNLYFLLKDLEKSLQYLEHGASIIKHNYGRYSLEYANAIIDLAGATGYLNDSLKTIEYLREYGDVMKAMYGSSSDEYINSLKGLANYYSYLENDQEAIELTKMLIKSLAPEHPSYFSLLWNLAGYYQRNIDYNKAILLHNELLNLCEEEHGRISYLYIACLKELALDYFYIGRYSDGIDKGTEALELYNQLENKKKTQGAAVLNVLALNYSGIGDLAKSIALTKQSVEIQEELLKQDANYELKEGYAFNLINLTAYYSLSDKHEECVGLGPKALKVCEEYLGKEHSKYAYLLNNLAISYEAIGNSDEALRLRKEDLQITEKRLGKNHPDYAQSLTNYADYVTNNEEALQLEEEALQIRNKTLGKKHPSYIKSAKDVSRIAYILRDTLKLEQYTMEATNLLRDYILDNFSGLIPKERTRMWEDNSYWFEYFIQFYALICPTDSLICNGYDGVLLSKGLLLNTELEMKNILKESNNLDIMKMYESLNYNKRLLNTEYEKPIKERLVNTDSLSRIIEKVERELTAKSKEYGDYTKNLRINWKDVRKTLTEKDIAIEFFSLYWNADSTLYAAYILKKGMKRPVLYHTFVKTKYEKDKSLYNTPQYCRWIWEPISNLLEGVENIYFAPAGELYNIAIESLPHWNEDCLMSDKWNMYRLSSTRQLAVIKDKGSLKKASVYGGVKYDTKEDLLIADSKRYQSRERSLNYEPFEIADSLNLRSGAAYLPATKAEAEEIDKTLEQKKIATSLKLDTLATEGTFKDLSGKKTNLLHIATHGFYWTEKEAKYRNNLDFLMMNDNMQPHYVEDKALTRSGLLLAGANNALMGKKLPEGVDDGILTAKEISQLDLRGLDLVVLSACQTGLGEIKGDGVFGLQRGFKKAGANSLLMSLWKVDDEATRLLMTQFYKNLTSGMSKYESLKLAQKYVREYEIEVEVKSDVRPSVSAHAKEQAHRNSSNEKNYKKVKKYQDPYYWAAFILLDAID